MEIAENELRRKTIGYAPNPLCEVCRGAGLLYPVDETGVHYDRLVACTAPGCLVEAREKFHSTGQYLQLKGVSERMQTFERFQTRPGSEATFHAFYQLANGETDKPFLLCYGPNGNGKTHLCQALTTTLNQRGIDARFYNVAELMRSIKSSIQDNSTDKWMKFLKEVQGLVLDDFGMELGSDWEMTQIDEVINSRWQDKLLTVVTTNKSLEQLKQKLPRIFSRLCDVDLSVVVINKATDYRLR